MKPISKAIQEFLEDCLNIYNNPHEVETCYFEDGTLCIAALWPGIDSDNYYSLSFTFECTTIDDFTDILGIRDITEFHALTPWRLLELYLDGKAEVTCSIDRITAYYELNFFKKGNVLFARDHYNNEHLVTAALENPAHFFEYLKVYANSQSIIL
jgi:hypothetical protein